ncbi:MAG: response regulator [bacterium]
MGKKILLADDSVTIQKVVELTLADEDYDMTMVSDGAAALQKAQEIQPDLILADIVMPELNGYELCEKIRRNPSLSHVPILLLCSTFETFDQARGTLVGADDHIIKPFESEELIRKIRVCLEKKPEPAKGPAPSPAKEKVAPLSEFTKKAVVSEPEKVEEEGFEFELTDEFMTEAMDSHFTSKEQTYGEPISEASVPSPEEDFAGEISPESFEEFPEPEEIKTTDAGAEESPAEEQSIFGEYPSSSGAQEIDKELIEEEEVQLYEIPEEYAEGPDILKISEVREEAPFQVEAPPMDMDSFMSREMTIPGPSYTPEPQQDLSEEEILSAVQEQKKPAFVKTQEVESLSAVYASEDSAESFEDVYPTWGATTSEWAPELTDFGGELEKSSDPVIEKPLKDKVVNRPISAVDEESVRKMLSEMVNKMASEIIERVAWEVIPDLAEMLIQKEIQRLQEKVEH